MSTYYMQLDGDCGSDEIEAESIEAAMDAALEWAAEGDWDAAQEGTEDVYGGCADVEVRVWREDEEGEIVEEERDTYAIPTLGDLQEQALADGEILAEDEGEFSTRRVVRVGNDNYYYQHVNGGARGAHDRMCGDGVWRERPIEQARPLSVKEASALMLDMGVEPQDIARLTR